MNIRKKLWDYCPKPIKRTRPYIERAYLRIQKEVVPSRRMKWLAISLYVASLLFVWLDYFTKLSGYATLEGALLYTTIVPPAVFAGFKVYKISSLKFWQSYWTVWGVFFLGGVMFAIENLLLLYALPIPAWREWEWENVDVRIALTLSISYMIGGYLGYEFGKRRGFGPLIF